MPGTTGAPLNLPYPVGGDPVNDGDNQVKDLADAVAALLVGANGLPVAGVSMTVGGSTVYRRARIAMLSLESLAATAARAAGVTLVTVPAGFRPPVTWRFTASNFTTGAILTLEIQANGNVIASNALALGNQVFGSVAYPVA